MWGTGNPSFTAIDRYTDNFIGGAIHYLRGSKFIYTANERSKAERGANLQRGFPVKGGENYGYKQHS